MSSSLDLDRRTADSRFQGTNGFADPITALMHSTSEEVPVTVGHGLSKAEMSERARQRELAEMMLLVKGTYGPGYVRFI